MECPFTQAATHHTHDIDISAPVITAVGKRRRQILSKALILLIVGRVRFQVVAIIFVVFITLFAIASELNIRTPGMGINNIRPEKSNILSRIQPDPSQSS